MVTIENHRKNTLSECTTQNWSNPIFQAFTMLRVGFTVAPILFGLDKFTHILVNWDIYLAPRLDRLIPGTAHQAMYAVGVIEIVAGLVVAVRPKYGSLLVSVWLIGIITNLLLIPGYYDIALRDFGLFLATIALFRLATFFDPRPLFSQP
jgi:hypothetical protein